MLSSVVPAALRPLISLQLSTRRQSPRLEALRQLAVQALPEHLTGKACCVLTIGAEHVTDFQRVHEALATASVEKAMHSAGTGGASGGLLTAIDHIVRRATNAQNATDAPTAILYGPPGAECFTALHRATMQALNNSDGAGATYAIRPVLLPGCTLTKHGEGSSASCMAYGTERPPALSGYGIQLAIKSMEYSQVDDASAPTASAQDGASGVVDTATSAQATSEMQQLSADMGTQHLPQSLRARHPLSSQTCTNPHSRLICKPTCR